MMDYIIVQAGGKGTRLEYLTKNKPKAIVPVNNLPMLFHLFRKYPDKKFVIIADYHREVLRAYLEAFAEVRFLVVEAEGTGTCSGLKQALSLIPEKEAFMLVWSDLILPEHLELPSGYADDTKPQEDYVGVSTTFPCRWKFEDGVFAEERSVEFGAAGFFLFTDKSKIANVPESGELIRWMRDIHLQAKPLSLAGTLEYGLIEEYEKLETEKCRPFNRIQVDGDVLTKEAVDEQGRKLAVRECAWYEKAKAYDIPILPKIYKTGPLQMEFIDGCNIYEAALSPDEKKNVLQKLTEALAMLHQKEHVPANPYSLKEAYFGKTMQRLSLIEDLVPFAREKRITVNGRSCRNVFFHKRKLERALERMTCDHFSFIHGDCTFSNLMLRKNGDPVLIDPRGYFGFTELYGDERYDWAKLYYSIVGNYDRFNLKKFRLDISGENGSKGDTAVSLPAGEVKLEIESNGWEDLEPFFFELTKTNPEEIRLLHAVIWLSLTTYAWQDYDSVCGAFYNGLYYLEEVL